jgi:DNA-binding CsgD family transcriptional regulator
MASGAALELVRPGPSLVPHEHRQLLTQRETQITQLLAVGLSSKQAADKLQISVYTVNQHIRAMLLKLKAANRAHAVAIALRKHLIS